MQHPVFALELAHAVLHRKVVGIKAFHDVGLFDETSKLEYEANIFAAEILMEDAMVLELVKEGISFFDAASTLGVPVEMLDFKIRTLNYRRHTAMESPLMAKGDFLRK